MARVCQTALESLQGAGLQRNLLQAVVENLSPKSVSVQQSQTGRSLGNCYADHGGFQESSVSVICTLCHLGKAAPVVLLLGHDLNASESWPPVHHA